MALIEMFDNAQNFKQMLDQLKQNPIAFAASKKYSIPEGMSNPEEITNYLIRSGQVNQQQLNSVMMNPVLKMFGGR